MLRSRIFAVLFLILGLLAGYFGGANFITAPDFLKIPFRLGLDLQGGAHLTYKADTSQIQSAEISEAMAGLRDVIERRINIFGVTEPVVQVEKRGDENRLIVELAGVFDINEAIKMIGETPYLEFRTAVTEPPKPGEASTTALTSFEPTKLTGRYLKKATLDFGKTTFEPTVLLEFNDEGSKLFADITRANVGKPVAIYLDAQPISVPVVREEIVSGRAEITGKFTPTEARDLVRKLNAGALPVPITLISQQSVGASLGSEALAKMIRAGIYGTILVALFLLIFYRLPGLAAVLALSIYISVVLAAFKLIPVTLTAAGIAGFILSIGMAVDANILIFERTREELRSGKTLVAAVEEGFSRAWLSIRDSNVSSLITSVILYWLGTSMVQGFALTLGIGILISMFSAIVITRTFLRALEFSAGGSAASGGKENRLIYFLFGARRT